MLKKILMITFIIYLINRDNKFYLYFLCYNKLIIGLLYEKDKAKEKKE